MTQIAAPAQGLASAEWLAQQLGRSDVVVLDSTTNIVADADGHERVVAERAAFEREHIPGAQFVDLQGELSDGASPYNFTLPSSEHFEAALQRRWVTRELEGRALRISPKGRREWLEPLGLS